MKKSLCIIMMMMCAFINNMAAPGSTDNDEKSFTVKPLSHAVIERMKGKSLPADKVQWAKAELRYVRVLHIGIDGKTHKGEIVCNKLIAEDLREIFLALYRQRYVIESIALVDEYGGNDNASMRANNTSCFNYRTVAAPTACQTTVTDWPSTSIRCITPGCTATRWTLRRDDRMPLTVAR